jgi:hypothetical protein
LVWCYRKQSDSIREGRRADVWCFVWVRMVGK